MKNKIFTITIIANIFFYLFIFSYEEKYLSSQSVDQLNKISIEEYNMSILTIDSNEKLISVITAIKLNNMNEEPFVPNFDVSILREKIEPCNIRISFPLFITN